MSTYKENRNIIIFYGYVFLNKSRMELAKEHGISPERIRQIVMKMQEKLKKIINENE